MAGHYAFTRLWGAVTVGLGWAVLIGAPVAIVLIVRARGMRRLGWGLVVVGLVLAIGVPLKAEHEIATFVGSTDYQIWMGLEDKRTWRPPALRTAEYRYGWRWPAVFFGGACVALGVLVLALRRTETGVV